MGKLKEYHFGNKSFHEYEDDFLDEDYHYSEWKKKKKHRLRKSEDDEELEE